MVKTQGLLIAFAWLLVAAFIIMAANPVAAGRPNPEVARWGSRGWGRRSGWGYWGYHHGSHHGYHHGDDHHGHHHGHHRRML
ncbi:unnamed protein product [Linum tenue]|uniref:Uncharacterized protein n=1 Tax=Linum tenue TaxID=586396 RepID=A0AAV0KLW8_9ROSI|nr:unnamed protein product [Linum tenue]